MALPETYKDWIAMHGVEHTHCPYDCDHPQPFILEPGSLVCGKCWFIHRIRTEMVPCAPEVCT